MGTIRIVLVEDHALVRQGVGLFLSREPDLEIVGEAGDAATALRVIAKTQADVVLMDVGLGSETSIGLTRHLKTTRPGLRVLVLSAHSDDGIVDDMLGAGADGYTLKDMAVEELARAIRAVAVGQFVLHPAVARRWSRLSRLGPPRPERPLSGREVEVLQEMAEGSTSKEIARRYGLSTKTVENHRAHILAKLDARNAAEAVSRAIEWGLVRRRGNARETATGAPTARAV
jgi:DNA-binding NarL/FixJ family response regulator